MNIVLLQIGKTNSGYIEDGITEYSKRLLHYAKFEHKFIPAFKGSHKLSKQEQINKEAEILKKYLNDKYIIILLDETGKEYTSNQFSMFLQKKLNQSRDIVFVIGGPFGFSEELKQKYTKVALSKMTLTHQMVRLFFVEQLYRAFTILKGENYHH